MLNLLPHNIDHLAEKKYRKVLPYAKLKVYLDPYEWQWTKQVGRTTVFHYNEWQQHPSHSYPAHAVGGLRPASQPLLWSTVTELLTWLSSEGGT